jgi:hypothetical protein
VSEQRFVRPASIPSGEQFGTPSLSSTIRVSGISTREGFGTPRVVPTISVASISSAETFGTPTVTSSAVVEGYMVAGLMPAAIMRSGHRPVTLTVGVPVVSMRSGHGRVTMTVGAVAADELDSDHTSAPVA